MRKQIEVCENYSINHLKQNEKYLMINENLYGKHYQVLKVKTDLINSDYSIFCISLVYLNNHETFSCLKN